eukprot:scaffold9046_cov60-Attheya_sp.AAC.2
MPTVRCLGVPPNYFLRILFVTHGDPHQRSLIPYHAFAFLLERIGTVEHVYSMTLRLGTRIKV